MSRSDPAFTVRADGRSTIEVRLRTTSLNLRAARALRDRLVEVITELESTATADASADFARAIVGAELAERLGYLPKDKA